MFEEYPCQHCDLPVHWISGKGWVHPKGRIYLMTCPRCGWIGEAPADVITIDTDRCPVCHLIGRLRDHHAAIADKTKAPIVRPLANSTSVE